MRRLGAAIVFFTLMLSARMAAADGIARVAWLGAGSQVGSADFVAALKQGLGENGLLEGRNYVFDAVYANGNYDRFPALVNDLLARNPSVIIAVTVSSVRAAQRATKSVPIVMVSTTDPVGSRLVETLARPGRNTTGLGNMASDISGKYVQLLHEIRPEARHLAVMINPKNPSSRPVYERIEKTARKAGIQAQAFEVTTGGRLDARFEALARNRPDGLTIIADNSFLDQRREICRLALEDRVPVIAFSPDFADAGCVIGFGAPRRELFRRSATYVRKLLAGADPAELPVELPAIFETTINLNAANALGMAIPQSILLRADRVIE